MGEIVIVDADSNVTVEAADDQTVRVKLGPEPYGVTLVGHLPEIHKVIIEADRQLSHLTRRSPDR